MIGTDLQNNPDARTMRRHSGEHLSETEEAYLVLKGYTKEDVLGIYMGTPDNPEGRSFLTIGSRYIEMKKVAPEELQRRMQEGSQPKLPSFKIEKATKEEFETFERAKAESSDSSPTPFLSDNKGSMMTMVGCPDCGSTFKITYSYSD